MSSNALKLYTIFVLYIVKAQERFKTQELGGVVWEKLMLVLLFV